MLLLNRARVFLSLAVVVMAVGATVRAEPHPPVNVPSDAVLFRGAWYKAYFEKLNWHTARDKCARLGGMLVVITDNESNGFVKSLAKGEPIWLGATDEKVNGQWVWVDGSTMLFKAWAKGEPNNHGGTEHYVKMVADGTWNDVRYEPRTPVAGYVCEWVQK